MLSCLFLITLCAVTLTADAIAEPSGSRTSTITKVAGEPTRPVISVNPCHRVSKPRCQQYASFVCGSDAKCQTVVTAACVKPVKVAQRLCEERAASLCGEGGSSKCREVVRAQCTEQSQCQELDHCRSNSKPACLEFAKSSCRGDALCTRHLETMCRVPKVLKAASCPNLARSRCGDTRDAARCRVALLRHCTLQSKCSWSLDHCKSNSATRCGTYAESQCKGDKLCASVLVRFCREPSPAPREECYTRVADRCGGVTGKFQQCREACLVQCQKQSECKVDPEEVTVRPTGPTKKPLCDARSVFKCSQLARHACGTSKGDEKCRATFRKYCQQPRFIAPTGCVARSRSECGEHLKCRRHHVIQCRAQSKCRVWPKETDVPTDVPVSEECTGCARETKVYYRTRKVSCASGKKCDVQIACDSDEHIATGGKCQLVNPTDSVTRNQLAAAASSAVEKLDSSVGFADILRCSVPNVCPISISVEARITCYRHSLPKQTDGEPLPEPEKEEAKPQPVRPVEGLFKKKARTIAKAKLVKKSDKKAKVGTLVKKAVKSHPVGLAARALQKNKDKRKERNEERKTKRKKLSSFFHKAVRTVKRADSANRK